MAALDTISKAEAIKQQSRQLRGHLARDLADTAHPFDKTGYSLLKFHGIYQGYDRDSATERKQRGDDKVWQFMVRVRIPGGRLTAEQYLALDGLADRYANGSLRVTTRQSIQFHGVVKRGLKRAIAEINGALLTTLAACGDVVRTVTTVPVPLRGPVPRRRPRDDAQQSRDVSASRHGSRVCRPGRSARRRCRGGAAAPRLGRPRQPPSCPAQIRYRRTGRRLGARAAVGGSRQTAGAVP